MCRRSFAGGKIVIIEPQKGPSGMTDYDKMLERFGQVYIEELIGNYPIVHPTASLLGYVIEQDGSPYILLGTANDQKVMWNPRVNNSQAFELQTELYMEIRTDNEENSVSIYIPALDKPLNFGEGWSMGFAQYPPIEDGYKVTVRRLISEVAALCGNRVW